MGEQVYRVISLMKRVVLWGGGGQILASHIEAGANRTLKIDVGMLKILYYSF